jgi:hypothetical protein
LRLAAKKISGDWDLFFVLILLRWCWSEVVGYQLKFNFIFMNFPRLKIGNTYIGEVVRVPPSGLPGSGVPDPQDGIIYIASAAVAAEAARIDVVTPASCED